MYIIVVFLWHKTQLKQTKVIDNELQELDILSI